jgi:hypothetical protein
VILTVLKAYFKSVPVHLKSIYIAWESRLKVVYKQYQHSSTVQPNEAPFIKDKTGRTPKVPNTSEGGVTDLRSEHWRRI